MRHEIKEEYRKGMTMHMVSRNNWQALAADGPLFGLEYRLTEFDRFVYITVRAPEYKSRNPGPGQTSKKIKLALVDIWDYFPHYYWPDVHIIKKATLDNRSAQRCVATWVVCCPVNPSVSALNPDEPAATVETKAQSRQELLQHTETKPPAPKPKTARRRRSRKTTKKTETEV